MIRISADNRIRDKVSGLLGEEYICEMTHVESGFLCELIQRYKPRKILEVGVAEGGTTCIILNTLQEELQGTKVYSIDISEKCYRREEKLSGYLARENHDLIAPDIEWEIYTGGHTFDFLKKIGKGIDMLILDTVHSLPGELLDYLAVIPFLSDNALIVIHDTMLHVNRKFNRNNSNVFLSSLISGQKILCDEYDNERELGYASIGAVLTENALVDAERIAESLIFTWEYLPAYAELEEYRKWYRRYYTDDFMYLFGKAICAQELIGLKRNEDIDIDIETIRQCILEEKPIYIYGVGFWGKHVHNLIRTLGGKNYIKGFVVSDEKNMDTKTYEGIIINQFNQILHDKDVAVIVAVSKEKKELVLMLNENGFQNVI